MMYGGATCAAHTCWGLCEGTTQARGCQNSATVYTADCSSTARNEPDQREDNEFMQLAGCMLLSLGQPAKQVAKY